MHICKERKKYYELFDRLVISCQYLKVIDYLLLFVSTADTDYLPITDSLLDYLYVTMNDK